MVETIKDKTEFEKLKHEQLKEKLKLQDEYAEREHQRKMKRLEVHLAIAQLGGKISQTDELSSD